MAFHNSALARLVPEGNYRAVDLARIEAALNEHQTLAFARLASGLYSASSAGESIAGTGYANVWIRDNIHVAFAHYVTGATPVANRPHVRFDGRTLSEIEEERWAHAQNDALGYFLWLSSTLAASGALKPDTNTVSVLTGVVRYLQAVRFWQDEDSGHWEEQRKISASSIGTVVAALEAFEALVRQRAEWREWCGAPLSALPVERDRRRRHGQPRVARHQHVSGGGAWRPALPG